MTKWVWKEDEDEEEIWESKVENLKRVEKHFRQIGAVALCSRGVTRMNVLFILCYGWNIWDTISRFLYFWFNLSLQNRFMIWGVTFNKLISNSIPSRLGLLCLMHENKWYVSQIDMRWYNNKCLYWVIVHLPSSYAQI